MIYIYNLIVFLVLTYIVFAKRSPDFLMVYALSSIVYYLPLSLGILINVQMFGTAFHYNEIEISIYTYIFGILNALFVLLWMLIKDNMKQLKSYPPTFSMKEQQENDQCMNIVSFVLLVLMIFSIYKHSVSLFNGNFNKVDFITKQTALESIVRYLGLYVGMYAFTNKRKMKMQRVISVIFILYSNLFGRRSDTVLIVVVIIIMRMLTFSYSKHNIFYYLKKNKVLFILGFLMTLLIMPVKRSLPIFISGRFIDGIQLTVLSIFDPKTYLISESNTITLYIQKILADRDYDMLFRPFFTDLLSLIPFGNRITNNWINEIGYDKYFSERYFPAFNAKTLAGSFWAESILNGGFIGFVITLNFLLLIIIKTERKILKNQNSIYNPFLMIVIIHMAFYIHRLHLSHLLNVIKYSFVSVIIVTMIKGILESVGIGRLRIKKVGRI